jgi:cysteinyl-tRNA synthetase
MLLDRRYDEAWDFDDAGLDAAGARLDALHTAAGGVGSNDAASGAVLDALADGMDVRGALDIAVAEGGQAARDLVSVLSL